jgi:hypothetical protein
MSLYSHKKTPFFKRPLVRVVLVALGIVLLWLGGRGVIKQIIVPPVYGDVVATALLSRNELIKKVTELETTVAADQVNLLELELLRSENEKLKAEFGRNVSDPGILAHVMSIPGRTFHDTFIIDAGSEMGIVEGEIVYAFNTIALGAVSEVSPRTATVELFSAPNKQTAGSVAGSELTVTLIGRGSGEYEVRMPRDIHFDIGEIVSYQSTSPAAIAQIEKIVGDPRDPFQRLLAKTPINLQTLKWVVVK